MASTESSESNKLDENFKLIKQGAEAKIYRCTYLGRPAIVKERFQKKYRVPELDEVITKDRIKNEARSIVRCKAIGIRTPCLYLVDMKRRRIYMEDFTQSMTIKDYLTTFLKNVKDDEKVDSAKVLNDLTIKIGTKLRRLHDNNIIHGDLTTSNMLLIPKDSKSDVNWLKIQDLEVVLIDFGLSFVDASPEDKGVDLYVLERALISTHNELPELFNQILAGYTSNKPANANETISKLNEVRARGRKRTMIG